MSSAAAPRSTGSVRRRGQGVDNAHVLGLFDSSVANRPCAWIHSTKGKEECSAIVNSKVSDLNGFIYEDFESLHAFANMKFEDGCEADHPGQGWKCIYAEYRLPYVTTPFFQLGNAFDKVRTSDALAFGANARPCQNSRKSTTLPARRCCSSLSCPRSFAAGPHEAGVARHHCQGKHLQRYQWIW